MRRQCGFLLLPTGLLAVWTAVLWVVRTENAISFGTIDLRIMSAIDRDAVEMLGPFRPAEEGVQQ